jgi:hypothetical protein
MLLTIALLTVLQAPAARDSIAGTWQIKGSVSGADPFTDVCTIKQSGSTLTGSCALGGQKSYDLTGEVKDGAITFKHGGDYEGQALTIAYSGTLVTAKEMKGTISVDPFGVGGDFSATPAPATR